MNVYAYELLYRFDAAHNFAGDICNPDKASSETVMTTFHSLGIEKITGGKKAFINFTDTLLEAGIATLFPTQYLVVEVLETVTATPSVLAACQQLKRDGYMLALDDFTYRPELRPLLALADIVKIDWLTTSGREIKALLGQLESPRPMLLAEKIETREAYEEARRLHFSLFQGYFFSKPTIVSEKKIEPMVGNYLQLMRLVNRSEVDFSQLAHIIRRDVVLSYRLLRLVNSAYFGIRHQVKDIQHGLAILGLKEIRKWISLLAMIGISSDKTGELVRISMIRGRFLELYGERFLSLKTTETLFMTGLFSLLDVILDVSMDEVFAQMPVPADVTAPLLRRTGHVADVLSALSAHEHGQWEEALVQCARIGLRESELTALYLEAVIWCNSFAD